MHLKRLQIVGFKTFADRTDIDLDVGLTAIVGPNGSGKSNLVDALLWVLGEQNPRLLRASAAQDVIFAGTEKRKSLGLAEVRLTIDNEDGALPLRFPEVSVVRKLYRSGESQYLLNGSSCRLKDIVDLFLDTGAGRGAYSVVTQAEIDAVLSARAEDRRELFEEAAGLNKYRSRKREALRRLEAASGSLTRVVDILTELEAQRDPMSEQAALAREAISLRERLAAIEPALLSREIQKTSRLIETETAERSEAEAAVLALNEKIAGTEREGDALRAEAHDLDARLEEARAACSTASRAVEQAEARLALLTERATRSGEQGATLAAEIADIVEREKAAEAEITNAETERASIDAALAEALAASGSRRSALAQLDADVARLNGQIERLRTAGLEAAREHERRAADLVARRRRVEESEKRLSALEARFAELKAAIGIALEAAQACECARVDTVALVQSAAAERDAARARSAGLREQQLVARGLRDDANRIHADRSARLRALQEMQASGEGMYQGVRAIIRAQAAGQVAGTFQPFVDLLRVPQHLRAAVEAVLGGALQDVVTRSEAEAKSAIEWLKRERAGRVTFRPLENVRPGRRLRAESISGRAGILGVAADLVETDPQYAPLVDLMLGRVVVAADMDSALDAARRMEGWGRIVTLDGELVSPDGALTGGAQAKGPQLATRKGEIDDLKAAMPALRSAVDEASGRVTALDAAIAAGDSEVSRIEAVRAEAAAAAASAASELAAAQRESARLEAEQRSNESARNALGLEIASMRESLARTEAEAGRRAESDAGAEKELERLQADAEDAMRRRDAARAAAAERDVETSRVQAERAALDRALKSARERNEALQDHRRQKQAQEAASCLDGARAASEADTERTRLKAAAEHSAAANAAAEELREASRALHVRIGETGAGVRELQHLRAQTSETLHAAELRAARHELQLAQLLQKILDEYGWSEQEALEKALDGAEGSQAEVARLRRDLRALGEVNIGAAAEFDRLTGRIEFLTGQRADLELARDGLLATIRDIDGSTRGIFMETFDRVNEEFQKLFARLFQGGVTRLTLTHPDDVLVTGIEVEAQPPGKKSQALSLLSGGERALTALALLFAFLTVRPSPFVLLDEVDAALDGANVERFAELVTEFSARSQMLVITHNATTMESAPLWHGVTMRDAGVSSVLTYRSPAADANQPQLPLPGDFATA